MKPSGTTLAGGWDMVSVTNNTRDIIIKQVYYYIGTQLAGLCLLTFLDLLHFLPIFLLRSFSL